MNPSNLTALELVSALRSDSSSLDTMIREAANRIEAAYFADFEMARDILDGKGPTDD